MTSVCKIDASLKKIEDTVNCAIFALEKLNSSDDSVVVTVLRSCYRYFSEIENVIKEKKEE